jgi:colanic acid/amylovoran biosynthesis glycosyltransferase
VRVLYLLRYYPTLTETFVYNEITRIQQLDEGVHISVAALGERDDGAVQDLLPEVEVLRVPRRPLTGRLRAATVGMRWLREHQRAKDAARLPWLSARLSGFDRIHVHFAGEAAEWARALWLDRGIPYTVMVHAVDLFRPRPSFVEVLRDAEAVLTIADHHVGLLAERGIVAERVRCGPSLEAHAGPVLEERAGLRGLFIGRDVPKKGLDTLLSAWESPPPGAVLEVISDRVGPVPGGVVLRGPQPAGVVRGALWRSDVLIQPCRRAASGDLDGVPVVLMEALAASRPVITTPVSGIPELVDESVGWLVPPDDVVALRAALWEASAPEERARRGDAGPNRLRDRGFTLTAQARGVLNCWRSGH